MVYAVIDTNVFVAALLTKNSDSATVKIYEAIANGLITPLYHKDILDEYSEVLSRPKLMILALSGQHSCNIRTRFLNYADKIPITLGQHS